MTAASVRRFPYGAYLNAAIRVLNVSPGEAWRMSPREIHFLVNGQTRTPGQDAPSSAVLSDLLRLDDTTPTTHGGRHG